MLASIAARGADTRFDGEIEECRAGEIATWADGVDRPAPSASLFVAYDPSVAPPWFAEHEVAARIARAATAWSQCGIPIRLVAWHAGLEGVSGLVVIQWSETESRGNFGLANLKTARLALSPKAFELLQKVNPAHDGRKTLQMVLSHEMGHLLGLGAHSRRCVDALSYYTNPDGEKCVTRIGRYTSSLGEIRSELPTACDIERCRKVNGMPPLPNGRLYQSLPVK